MKDDYKEMYQKLLTGEQISRRERIALAMIARSGYDGAYWIEEEAAAMEKWIDGGTKPTKKEPRKKEITVASWLPEKPKRKYTKRSKRWKKKSAKKAA